MNLKTVIKVANNLAASYIRIIDGLEKANREKEIKAYAQKAEAIFSNPAYRNFTKGNFQKTKKYFEEKYAKYLKWAAILRHSPGNWIKFSRSSCGIILYLMVLSCFRLKKN